MFLALGVGAYWVAIFHLFTHAFFKALLFLGSGSVIHALGGEQDMRHMGGLKDKIPITHWTMFIGFARDRRHSRLCGFLLQGRNSLAVVQLAAGLELTLWRGPRHRRLDGVLHVAADEHDVLRQVARRAPEVEAHIHESPASMTLPLSILAAGSILAGWIGTPKLWGMSGLVPRIRAVAGAVLCLGRRGSHAGRGARRKHRVDSNERLGGSGAHRHQHRPLLLSSSP